MSNAPQSQPAKNMPSSDPANTGINKDKVAPPADKKPGMKDENRSTSGDKSSYGDTRSSKA